MYFQKILKKDLERKDRSEASVSHLTALNLGKGFTVHASISTKRLEMSPPSRPVFGEESCTSKSPSK